MGLFDGFVNGFVDIADDKFARELVDRCGTMRVDELIHIAKQNNRYSSEVALKWLERYHGVYKFHLDRYDRNGYLINDGENAGQ